MIFVSFLECIIKFINNGGSVEGLSVYLRYMGVMKPSRTRKIMANCSECHCFKNWYILQFEEYSYQLCVVCTQILLSKYI